MQKKLSFFPRWKKCRQNVDCFRAFSTVENGKLAFLGDVGVRSGHYIKTFEMRRKYVKYIRQKRIGGNCSQ